MNNAEMVKMNELKTPCFVFEEAEFVRNLLDFKRVLNQHFEKAILGYSFKTNSFPRLLNLVKQNGCMAEVVSDDEYNLAKAIGFSPNSIIFNGPVKEKKIFLDALENGSLVNIDSQREIDWLCEYNKTVDVGIRVNIDLEKILPGHTSTKEMGGRFGFCYENGQLHEAICHLKNSKTNICRLHMHVSNASKSEDVYKVLAEVACHIIDEEKLDISYVDFGGGYFGGGDNGKSYEKYVDVIQDSLKKFGKEKIGIIVEPGASVVATAFSYLTKIIDIKTTTYGNFVITDGTRLHIDPFFNKEKYIYSLLSKGNNESCKQTICGYTCMEKDRIMTICDSRLQVDDWIEYKIVGSYTMCFNPLFISYLPRVYSKISDDCYVMARDKWSVNEYIQKCRWEF